MSIEFAAVTPVLILMIIGAYDLARAFQVDQQALSAATWIVAGASTLSLQPDQSLSLSTSAATTAMSAFYGAFPQTVPEGSNPAAPGNYSVALSEVIFTNPSQPTVIWTAPLTEGTANNLSGPGYERSCSGYLTPTTQFLAKCHGPGIRRQQQPNRLLHASCRRSGDLVPRLCGGAVRGQWVVTKCQIIKESA